MRVTALRSKVRSRRGHFRDTPRIDPLGNKVSCCRSSIIASETPPVKKMEEPKASERNKPKHPVDRRKDVVVGGIQLSRDTSIDLVDGDKRVRITLAQLGNLLIQNNALHLLYKRAPNSKKFLDLQDTQRGRRNEAGESARREMRRMISCAGAWTRSSFVRLRFRSL